MDLSDVVTNWLRDARDDPQREQFFADLAENRGGGVLFDIPCDRCPNDFASLFIYEKTNGVRKYIRVSQRTMWSSKLKSLDVRWQDCGDVYIIAATEETT